MLSMIMAVVVGIGVSKLVDAALYGAKKLTGKTDTKVDDKVVDFLREHQPDVVKWAEKALGLDGDPATNYKSAPRPPLRDHRGG